MINIAQAGVLMGFKKVSDFDADYQAVLDRSAALGYALPSAGQQIKQNQLVLALKLAGVWALLDILYILATDGDSDFATLNWKVPTSFKLTKINSPTFTNNIGFNGNGTTSYLQTGFIPGTDGVNYTLINASIFHHINSNVAETGVDYGGGNASASQRTTFISRNASDVLTSALNGSTATSNASVNSVGFYLNDRTAQPAGNHQIYKNGSVFDASNGAGGAALSTFQIYLCANNNSGTLQSFNAKQISCFGLGASLLSVQSSLYTAWNTYFTSL